jgi:hypothetical protein
VLPGISTEQLRSRLNRMVADGLLTRQRYREVPPRVDYELTERSKDLMPVLGALARWGYSWTWSSPKAGEEINIGAIFRLAPGLLAPAPGLRGTTEIAVQPGDGQGPEIYVLTAADGVVTVSERPAEAPDSRVSGSVDAWVRALGPEADSSELEYSGARELGETMVAGFADAAATTRAVATA